MNSRLAALLAALGLSAALGACIHLSPDRPDGGRLMDDVRALSTDEMQGRMIDTKGSVRARGWILNRLKQEGVRPFRSGWMQTFNFAAPDRPGTVRGVNVVGYVPGRRHPDKFIVISAHYDHMGVEDGQIFNGADDNASGVAGMLDIAHRLRGQAPDHSVIFVALDGEEEGLKGAEAFVARPPVPVERMVLNINLDMIARLDKGEIYAVGAYQFPALKPALERAAQGSKVTLLFGRDRPVDKGRDNWVALSDQQPFYAAGVPFIFFSVDDHDDYHKPSDDPERIPIPFFEAGVELIADAFWQFDKMDLAAVRAGPRNQAVR